MLHNGETRSIQEQNDEAAKNHATKVFVKTDGAAQVQRTRRKLSLPCTVARLVSTQLPLVPGMSVTKTQ